MREFRSAPGAAYDGRLVPRVGRKAWLTALAALALALALTCCIGVGTAAGGPRAEPKIVHLNPTKTLREKWHETFLNANRHLTADDVDGPLWGASCADALRESSRRKCITYFRYGRQYYADALFSVGGDRPDVQTFRRPARGGWRTYGGFGYSPPLPCPVRRAFGRPC